MNALPSNVIDLATAKKRLRNAAPTHYEKNHCTHCGRAVLLDYPVGMFVCDECKPDTPVRPNPA